MVSETAPDKCTKCGSTKIHQDEDVLDTWFSSALWPFSTLGWPEETEDLKYFYPTDVLVTGYDIIFFWVVRMVFSALEITGESPFKYVYVHGLVRDAQGRKMSKSLGNGIDPLEIIDVYGADALRFMLTTGITPGNDMRFSEDKIESARNFANKLWNASRFVIMNMGESLPVCGELKDEDKWMISRVNEAVRDATDAMDKFDLALAGKKVYDVIWNEYCDWYIEIVKERLYGSDEADKNTALAVLNSVLKDLLRLLHPFMPFITEEIWGYLPKEKDEDGYLINAAWPEYDGSKEYPQETARLETAKEVIRAIRGIRVEANASPGVRLTAYIEASDAAAERCRAGERYIKKLANITAITFTEDRAGIPEDAMSAVISGAEIFIPLEELVDMEAECERLRKEKERLEKEVKRSQGMLSNQGFLSKAPEKKINEEKTKKAEYEDMLSKVCIQLEAAEKRIK